MVEFVDRLSLSPVAFFQRQNAFRLDFHLLGQQCAVEPFFSAFSS